MGTKRLSEEIRERRERLGVTQTALAEAVQQLSGDTKFTQQSISKFENNPDAKSAYSVYMLLALDKLDPETSMRAGGSSNLSVVWDSENAELFDSLDDETAVALITKYLKKLPRLHRVAIAQSALIDLPDDA